MLGVRTCSRASHFGHALSLVIVLLCGSVLSGRSLAAEYEVDAVKAAFLHRFAAFVEWPENASSQEPFTIAVFSADRVVVHLERLLPDLRIRNRRARVRALEVGGALEGVDILYIGHQRLAEARDVLAAATGRPILIVTDEPAGLTPSAVINFVQVGRNVRFEASLPAAERNRLHLSSGLLSVAVRVEGAPRSYAAPLDLTSLNAYLPRSSR